MDFFDEFLLRNENWPSVPRRPKDKPDRRSAAVKLRRQDAYRTRINAHVQAGITKSIEDDLEVLRKRIAEAGIVPYHHLTANVFRDQLDLTTTFLYTLYQEIDPLVVETYCRIIPLWIDVTECVEVNVPSPLDCYVAKDFRCNHFSGPPEKLTRYCDYDCSVRDGPHRLIEENYSPTIERYLTSSYHYMNSWSMPGGLQPHKLDQLYPRSCRGNFSKIVSTNGNMLCDSPLQNMVCLSDVAFLVKEKEQTFVDKHFNIVLKSVEMAKTPLAQLSLKSLRFMEIYILVPPEKVEQLNFQLIGCPKSKIFVGSDMDLMKFSDVTFVSLTMNDIQCGNFHPYLLKSLFQLGRSRWIPVLWKDGCFSFRTWEQTGRVSVQGFCKRFRAPDLRAGYG